MFLKSNTYARYYIHGLHAEMLWKHRLLVLYVPKDSSFIISFEWSLTCHEFEKQYTKRPPISGDGVRIVAYNLKLFLSWLFLHLFFSADLLTSGAI